MSWRSRTRLGEGLNGRRLQPPTAVGVIITKRAWRCPHSFVWGAASRESFQLASLGAFFFVFARSFSPLSFSSFSPMLYLFCCFSLLCIP